MHQIGLDMRSRYEETSLVSQSSGGAVVPDVFTDPQSWGSNPASHYWELAESA